MNFIIREHSVLRSSLNRIGELIFLNEDHMRGPTTPTIQPFQCLPPELHDLSWSSRFSIPSQEIRQPCPYYHDPGLLLLVYFGTEIKQSMTTFTPEPNTAHESFVIQKSEDLSHWSSSLQHEVGKASLIIPGHFLGHCGLTYKVHNRLLKWKFYFIAQMHTQLVSSVVLHFRTLLFIYKDFAIEQIALLQSACLLWINLTNTPDNSRTDKIMWLWIMNGVQDQTTLKSTVRFTSCVLKLAIPIMCLKQYCQSKWFMVSIIEDGTANGTVHLLY